MTGLVVVIFRNVKPGLADGSHGGDAPETLMLVTTNPSEQPVLIGYQVEAELRGSES